MEFSNLPSEMKIEILSRLPIRSAVKCKLVDKSWCSLIESPEFAISYKSAPYLAVTQKVKGHPYPYKVYEVEDGDGNSKNSCNEAFNFSFPHPIPLHTSVNGWLFMCGVWRSDLYVCNPVTREYISIPSPRPDKRSFGYDSYGFGVSRKSGQYKLVRIEDTLIEFGEQVWRQSCQVYTLGTGLWRNVAPSSRRMEYDEDIVGAFVNGNFHWLAHDDDLEDSEWISCFDLETELFTALSAPSIGHISLCTLSAVMDSLCLCDTSSDYEIVIWLMKEYGDGRSWTKQFVISKMNHRLVEVIHVFEDGDALVKRYRIRVLCYSNKIKTIQETDESMKVSYTPSFIPLKTFSLTENVSSF